MAAMLTYLTEEKMTHLGDTLHHGPIAPPAAHICGRLTPRHRHRAEQYDWIIAARAAGFTHDQMCKALGVDRERIKIAVRLRIGRPGKDNRNAVAVRIAKLREARNQPKNGVTYADLHAQGLTMSQAARARHDGISVARTWARDAGVKWPDGHKTKGSRDRLAEVRTRVEAERIAGWKAMHLDPARSRKARMTPEQRADYEAYRKAHYKARDALIAIGRPDLVDVPPITRRSPAAKAEKLRQRRIAQDPEAALLEVMRRDRDAAEAAKDLRRAA